MKNRLAATRSGLGSCLVAVALQLAHSAAATAEPYRLHAQDRLMVRVLTWDFRLNSLSGWQGLSGEYSISPEGNLHLPLAGTLAAEGLTQAELSDAAGELLRRRAGLDEQPMLSIELVSSLPVYVLGSVETRGAVSYRPGLTARQALSLAGGLFRAPAAQNIARTIVLSGEITEAQSQLRALRDEQARIQQELAELENAPFAAPQDVTRSDDVQSRLQEAEREARQVRLDSYSDLAVVLGEKADRLNQQLVLRDEQIAATREELASITSLNERGLAVNARVTSLSSALSELEAKRLEIETALLLLDEQRNQAARDRDTITTDAIASRLARLVQLEPDIANAEIGLSTAQSQLQVEMGVVMSDEDETAEPLPVFTLTRGGQEQEVSPSAELHPGDTLEITTRLPENTELSQN
ncbi:polysaccharide biosynthesis/export family protein [Paracoccus sediminicola]|nr:polysaccharide biosynthesis/export family protein [Paracoccus sediminicola]WBU58429.1 polysaccharide biosynthesis/export family protein [Paracoccus sediminicola]